MKITIIGGGNIGGATARGIAESGVTTPENITVTAASEVTLEKIKSFNPNIQTSTDNISAVKDADIIILAIKPWKTEEVINQIKPYLDYSYQSVASIVAAYNFDALTSMLDNGSRILPTLYRIIPNTAISLSESVTFIAAERSSETQTEAVKNLFVPTGLTFVIPESMMSAGTSLASCGIAFALKYLDASIEAGVESGFTQNEARDIVIKTMRGALKLLETNNTMPQTEIDKVTTPGGLTLKGLEAMRNAGFTEAIKAGIKKSR